MRLLVGLVAVGLLSTGCVQTVAGTAQRGGNGSASAVELEQLLLSPAEVDSVVGSVDIEVTDSVSEMIDLADSLSDPTCTGAMYNAEASVYQDSGWTEVIDQVLTEPSDDSQLWVEQTIVQMSSDQQALDFFNESVTAWTNCIGKQVAVDDGEEQTEWRFDGVGISGTTMTQTVRQTEEDWACQHALGATGNRIVEASVCTVEPSGEAMRVTNQIIEGLA